MKRPILLCLLTLAVLLSACASGAATAVVTDAPEGEATAAVTAAPEVTGAPAATTEAPNAEATAAPTAEVTAAPGAEATEPPALSFESTQFSDLEFGYSLDFPAGWQVDEAAAGDRAGMVQFTSWEHEPGSVSEIPDGETMLQVLTQQWDPKGDLVAFVGQRKMAWEASGIKIVREEALTLPGLGDAVELILEGTDGAQSYVLITVLGDIYLVAGGNGNLDLLSEIGRTLRVES